MLRKLKTLSWSFLACVALVPIGCERFSSCEDTLCDDGPGGGGAGGGGSDLGGGGAGAGTGGVVVDPCDACSGETPLCNADDECVECLEATDCDAPSASKCTDSGACIPCAANVDCAHVGGTNVCDEGTCVECLSEDDCVVGEEKFVCAPDTKTCTDTVFRSVDVCQECAHDLDCKDGQLCVEMRYNDPSDGIVGSFCLWRKDAGGVGPNGVCGTFRPYAATLATRSADDATVREFCSLRTTTCVALNQFATEVTGCNMAGADAACGAPGFNDGRCRLDGDDNPECTYPCVGVEDCPAGVSCLGGVGSSVCSL